MPPIHLVTGATGFLGSALVLELLRETSDHILCMARPAGDPRAATYRVRAALERAARASQQEDLLERSQGRWRAIPGDLLLPGCALDASALPGITGIWHAAASLRFEPELESEIHAHNVEGTRRLLGVARALGVGRFQYVSTAFVAGARSGRILEQLHPASTPVNNAYERSKILAEHLVADSGLDYRIFRPSIVIGYTKTASAAGSDSGFYGYIQRLVRLRRVLARRDQLAQFASTYLPGDPSAPLDLVPVDAVVHNMVSIARAPSAARIFHLTNACPPLVGAVARTLSQRLRIDGPRFRPGDLPCPEGTEPRIGRVVELMQFFLAYVSGGKVFDRCNTDAVIGPEASLWPLDAEGTGRYVDRYLEELDLRERSPAGLPGR